MDNLQLYNQVRKVPKEALKEIIGGKLKGKSDINPMWRIKVLTEQFGPCGFGWYYSIDRQWLERNEATGEVAAFCNISLHVKIDGEWSKGIEGNGGSSFIASTKNGLEVSDECYKMALTDALSVACKALGFAADVYWANDNTKYTRASDKGNGTAVPTSATNNSNNTTQGPSTSKAEPQQPQPFQGSIAKVNEANASNGAYSAEDLDDGITALHHAKTVEELKNVWEHFPNLHKSAIFIDVCKECKSKLLKADNQ